MVLSEHTTSGSGVSARTAGQPEQEGGCAVRSAANARPASSTRATSTIRRRSGAGASARRAPRGSRPTSGSRPPGSSSSSATGRRQEFDRDKLAAGLRKALTRRPVADGAAETAADAIEAELRSAGASEVPSSRIGALAMEKLRGHRPDRLHPVRQRLPELRGPRGPQARGRHAVRRARAEAGRARDERPLRPRHPGRDRGRRVRIDPYDPADLQPSSVDLHLDRSFRVFRNNRYPYIDVRAPQPDLTELLRIEDDEPFVLHPGEFVLGQTLEWVELPERPRRPARREVESWGGSGCSSTRPRATSTRAGRAT